MSLLSITRDHLVEKFGLPAINKSFLAPYGSMTSLSVDSAAKSAEAILELNGEPEPIRVEIGKYELAERGNETILFIRALQISRDWMQTAAEEFLVGRPLKVPRDAAAMLRRFL